MKKKFLPVILWIVCGQMLFSQNFTEKQKSVIFNEAIKSLQNYQDYINQIADEAIDINKVNKTGEKLIDLFIARKILIYNDLDPSHQLSEYYELDTYVSNLKLWYPDGMKIILDFDDLKAGTILSHEDNIYSVDLMTRKAINGNYINKQKNTNTEELLFRVAFYQKGNSFENFKIAGIRSSKSDRKLDDSRIIAEVKNAGFDAKEMQKIKELAKAQINEYINLLNLFVDPKESAEDKGFYKTSFLALFKDEKVNLVNDIEPQPQERWMNVNNYLQNLVQSYPEGIHNIGLNVDSAEFSKAIPTENEKFYIHVFADKFFSGKFRDKTAFRDNSRLDFKITFERDENTYKNFKIESIDKYGLNYYTQNNATSGEIPQLKVFALKRKKLYFGFSIINGISGYSNKDLSDENILRWDIKNKYGIRLGVSARYYPTNILGVETGVSYNSYAAHVQLNGSFQNNEYSIDPNNEQYLKIVSASYDSLLSVNYLNIPLNVIFHTNKKPDNWGIYIKAGIVTSFLLNSKYETKGNFKTLGYYENSYYEGGPQSSRYFDMPELGFIDRSNINESGKADLKTFHLSMITAFGVTLPLNYYTSVEIGPEIHWGITDISRQKNYINAFGSGKTAKKTSISQYGFKLGINYKF